MIYAGTGKVIAMGASTGGVAALEYVFSRLPKTIPPIVLVLHMQAGFSRLYAARLNDKLEFTAKEAKTGDLLLPGQLLIAPAGKHMRVVRRLGKLEVELKAGPKVQHVIPSADVLFESVAETIGKNAIGALLTGLGADGAAGLLKMRQNGAPTIGQDRQTSAVYGMPKVAKELGAVQYELPLERIAGKILSLI